MGYTLFSGNLLSNSTPSGFTAAANHEADAGRAAWKAFDGSTDTLSYWYDEGSGDHWCYFHSTASHILTKYILRTYNDGGTNPNPYGWHVDGSSNGSSWTTIESRTQSLAVNTAYTFSNVAWATTYTYYRIYITSTGPAGVSDGGCAVCELSLYEGGDPAGTGAKTLPSFTCSGSGIVGSIGTGGTGIFGHLTASGAGISSKGGTGGSNIFGVFTSAGAGIAVNAAIGDCIFPAFSGSGSGLAGALADGTPSFPMLSMLADGLASSSGSGDITFPSFQIASIGFADVPGYGSPSFPMLTILADGMDNGVVHEGVGAASFPSFRLDASTYTGVFPGRRSLGGFGPIRTTEQLT